MFLTQFTTPPLTRRTPLPVLLLLAAALTVTASLLPLAAKDANPDNVEKTDEQIRKAIQAEIEQARLQRVRVEEAQRAHELIARQDFIAAATILKKLIADKPETPLLLELGQADIGLKSYREARSDYRKALDLEPAQPLARRALGWLAYRESNYIEALQWWEPLLQSGSRDGEILTGAGECYYYTQRRQAALQCFQAAAVGKPDDRDLTRWQIFCANDIGEYELADRLARGYLSAVPGDAEVREIDAHCAVALHRNEDAMLALERLNLDHKLTPSGWTLLGRLYSQAQDDSRAAECFEAAAGDKSKLKAEDWMRLAEAHERAGNATKAREYFLKVSASFEDYPLALLGLARAAITAGNFEEALRQGAAAAKLRPDLGEAHFLLAETYERKNANDQSAAEYQIAATSPAFAADAYLGLGRIEYIRKNSAAALRYYQSAGALRPDDKGLAKIIAQLESQLQSSPNTP